MHLILGGLMRRKEDFIWFSTPSSVLTLDAVAT